MNKAIMRFAITNVNDIGLRGLTCGMQGRFTYGTRDEAQAWLDEFLTNNCRCRIEDMYGAKALGTFRVDEVECYSGHHDPVSCYVD